ncbi:MAG: DUF222 domain-containing protein [Gammaproteobacteria bacterium]|nr:DUF222 domain-containing protein [Gammaproteobacteria bacterium]
MDVLDEVTADGLEQELAGLELLIGRARARQLTLLAEVDRRQIPLGDGCRSMDEWVSSRLDVAPETASALTRTTRSLTDAPEVNDALRAGRVSFDRAVELCRYAATGADDPVESARHLDIAGLRRAVAHRRRLMRRQEAATFTDRYLAMQPNLDETSWHLWGILAGVDGRIVEEALVHRADRFPALPDRTRPTLGQRNADALVALATDSLDATTTTGTGAPLLSIFVDVEDAARTGAETGVCLDTGIRIGPESLAEALCTGSIETITVTGGRAMAVGRRTRVVSPTLRRAVLHRDHGSCTADGCTSRYRLQPHHINPFSQGGRTDPDNLTTLCWYHHHVVIHGMGYTIDRNSPPERLRFRKPCGGPDPP